MGRYFQLPSGAGAWNLDKEEEFIAIDLVDRIESRVKNLSWYVEFRSGFFDSGLAVLVEHLKKINSVTKLAGLPTFDPRETNITEYARNPDKSLRALRRREILGTLREMEQSVRVAVINRHRVTVDTYEPPHRTWSEFQKYQASREAARPDLTPTEQSRRIRAVVDPHEPLTKSILVAKAEPAPETKALVVAIPDPMPTSAAASSEAAAHQVEPPRKPEADAVEILRQAGDARAIPPDVARVLLARTRNPEIYRRILTTMNPTGIFDMLVAENDLPPMLLDTAIMAYLDARTGNAEPASVAPASRVARPTLRQPRGGHGGRLSDNDRWAIVQSGEPLAEICRRFNVSEMTVYAIKRGTRVYASSGGDRNTWRQYADRYGLVVHSNRIQHRKKGRRDLVNVTAELGVPTDRQPC
ncbi:MAG TPA: hypothetical protein VD978_31460 [Azospirillum sp.]|nr:hypothetical protein [Azospirillum sp.]